MSLQFDGRVAPARRGTRSPAVPDPTKDAHLLARALDRVAEAPELAPDERRNLRYLPDGDVHITSAGVRIVFFRQEYFGLPVYDATRSVRLDKAGRVLRVDGEVVPVPTGIPITPRVNANVATLAACRHFAGLPENESGELKVSDHPVRTLGRFGHPCRPTALHKAPFPDPIVAHLTLFPMRLDVRLAWEIHLEVPGERGEYEVLVAADQPDTAELLLCRRTSSHVAARGPIFEFNPSEAPRVEVDLPCLPEDLPDFGTLPVPNGDWVDEDSTDGNAAVSRKGNTKKSLRGVLDDGDVVFTPSDATGTDQRLFNAFYWGSFLHDFFYPLGFDETAGNFQEVNEGAGGEDGDNLVLKIFDSAFDGVASMRSKRDGKNPELKLGLLGDRHSALDADILIHEYVHGVTNRIIGGRHSHDPLRGKPQSEAMGEGYSDYFALTVLNFYRRRAEAPVLSVYGGWIANKPTGLRNFAYDEAFPGNYGTLGTPEFDKAHDAGQVWCFALLELHRVLADVLEPEAADVLGWRLVMDSLKLITPGSDSPSFLHGRDALLEAFDDQGDAGMIPGDIAALRSEIVKVFSGLGMGPAAQSPNATYSGIVTDFGGNP